MEIEMLIAFSSVGLIVATVLWLTLPWEMPEHVQPAKPGVWGPLDYPVAPQREPSSAHLTPNIADQP